MTRYDFGPGPKPTPDPPPCGTCGAPRMWMSWLNWPEAGWKSVRTCGRWCREQAAELRGEWPPRAERQVLAIDALAILWSEVRDAG